VTGKDASARSALGASFRTPICKLCIARQLEWLMNGPRWVCVSLGWPYTGLLGVHGHCTPTSKNIHATITLTEHSCVTLAGHSSGMPLESKTARCQQHNITLSTPDHTRCESTPQTPWLLQPERIQRIGNVSTQHTIVVVDSHSWALPPQVSTSTILSCYLFPVNSVLLWQISYSKAYTTAKKSNTASTGTAAASNQTWHSGH